MPKVRDAIRSVGHECSSLGRAEEVHARFRVGTRGSSSKIGSHPRHLWNGHARPQGGWTGNPSSVDPLVASRQPPACGLRSRIWARARRVRRAGCHHCVPAGTPMACVGQTGRDWADSRRAADHTCDPACLHARTASAVLGGPAGGRPTLIASECLPAAVCLRDSGVRRRAVRLRPERFRRCRKRGVPWLLNSWRLCSGPYTLWRRSWCQVPWALPDAFDVRAPGGHTNLPDDTPPCLRIAGRLRLVLSVRGCLLAFLSPDRRLTGIRGRVFAPFQSGAAFQCTRSTSRGCLRERDW